MNNSKKTRKKKEIMKQVPWTKTMLEDFIQEALLTEDEAFLMRTRVSGWSQIRQSMEMNISTTKVSSLIKSCKEKYDRVAEQFPDRFPPRKLSKAEEAMDANERTPENNADLCKTCSIFKESFTALELINCMNDCHYKIKK